MKRKLLTLFTLIALLIAFSIPVMQNTLSNSVIQNTMLSPLASYSSKGGSIDWQVQVSNAQGWAIAVTPEESYIYVAGAHLTDPTNSSSGKPTLWKYTTSGNPVWNITIDNINASSSFEDVAISPDGGSIYAAGSYPNGTMTIPYYPYTVSLSDAIVVKVDASTGYVDWNYTLNGPSNDDIRAIAVSPDGKSVYVAGELSKSGDNFYIYNFYVNALNASDGTPLWNKPYETYVNNSVGTAYDLVVSPISEAVYASGYYSLSIFGSSLTLVALNTADGNPLWNITSTTYFEYSSIEVSSNGSEIYALAPHVPEYENFLIHNASDGSLLQNVTINRKGSHIQTGPLTFAISQDESKIYIPGIWLGFPDEYMLLVEFDRLSGNPIGVIKANDLSTYPYDVAASRDNKSVYITGVSAGYMFLLMGQPEPLYSWLPLLLLFYTMLSQKPIPSSSTVILLVVAGIAVVLVVSFLIIVKTLRSERV